MELTLSENIRALRKQRRLTQEQFAEVLGVTTGAVYKWESGLSVPELDLIVEMADFFDTSVDVLLGYKMKDNRIASTLKRIDEYCRSMDPEALAEAEKALKKYPNDFQVVHTCANVYMVFGAGSKDRSRPLRALELLEQARLLISQNTDPKISEFTLFGDMANAYLMLGEYEKCVELLKKHNIDNIFSDQIGVCLTVLLKRPDEGEPFLAKAMIDSLLRLNESVCGCVCVHWSRGKYGLAKEMLEFNIKLLLDIRKEGEPDYTDKLYAELLAMLGYTQLKLGETGTAVENIKNAARIAKRFDAAPNYGINTLRFDVSAENANIHDLMGVTAVESIERSLSLYGDEAVTAIWKEAVENE